MMGTSNNTTRFESVRRQAQKARRCPVCEKRVERRTTFEQTINPFNTLLDGTSKTRVVIEEELRAEASSWMPDFTHAKCAGETAKGAS